MRFLVLHGPNAHVLADRFDEHDGPVRGVHFHKSQPLFVSGGALPRRTACPSPRWSLEPGVTGPRR